MTGNSEDDRESERREYERRQQQEADERAAREKEKNDAFVIGRTTGDYSIYQMRIGHTPSGPGVDPESADVSYEADDSSEEDEDDLPAVPSDPTEWLIQFIRNEISFGTSPAQIFDHLKKMCRFGEHENVDPIGNEIFDKKRNATVAEILSGGNTDLIPSGSPPLTDWEKATAAVFASKLKGRYDIDGAARLRRFIAAAPNGWLRHPAALYLIDFVERSSHQKSRDAVDKP